MIVIAEEVPALRHTIPPGQQNVSEQAGKHFRVICAYKTSSDCVNMDAKNDKGNAKNK